ncbi:cilia- and flagella-associated protein 90 [Osmerus mordax]|uniref:cilia- and flagella-associated protein 90 n=1 Tax=Osmerus mordax TaxID=8014 RepID=UPI00350F2DC8
MDVFQEAKTKPISIVSVYSYIPSRRAESKETTYFNCESKTQEITAYDCLYRRAEGYDNKLHRDDRQHFKGRGLDFYSEESTRPAPVRSSSEYGRRLPPSLYKPCRQYARGELIRAEFFRKNGISRSVEEGYGSVVPV